MASLKEYCARLSTIQLEALLREDCAGRGDLSVDTILVICEVLAERKPSKVPVEEKFREFCTYYLKKRFYNKCWGQAMSLTPKS